MSAFVQKCGLFFLSFMLCFGAAAHAAEPYRLGAVLAVTGAASFLGEPEKNTLLMLQEQINKAGGIQGKPLEIVIEDSRSDETQAVLAAKKLLNSDQVIAIIGPSTTGESLALAPILNAAQTPMISLATGAAITQPVNERFWIFKVAQYDFSVAEALFSYLKRKHISRVGIVTISTGYGDSGRKALQEIAPKFGITIVADERYGAKDADMTTQLVKIKAAGAQAIINWSVGPGQVVVTKNWHALKMGIPLFQSHGWGSKRNIALAGKAAEGVIAPLGRLVVWDKLPDTNPQKSILKKFSADYETHFRSEPGTFGGHAYDALMMIADALKKAGADKKAVRDHLEKKIRQWPGTGGVFTMSPTDHCGLDRHAFEIVRVTNGDWELLR